MAKPDVDDQQRDGGEDGQEQQHRGRTAAGGAVSVLISVSLSAWASSCPAGVRWCQDIGKRQVLVAQSSRSEGSLGSPGAGHAGEVPPGHDAGHPEEGHGQYGQDPPHQRTVGNLTPVEGGVQDVVGHPAEDDGRADGCSGIDRSTGHGDGKRRRVQAHQLSNVDEAASEYALFGHNKLPAQTWSSGSGERRPGDGAHRSPLDRQCALAGRTGPSNDEAIRLPPALVVTPTDNK